MHIAIASANMIRYQIKIQTLISLPLSFVSPELCRIDKPPDGQGRRLFHVARFHSAGFCSGGSGIIALVSLGSIASFRRNGLRSTAGFLRDRRAGGYDGQYRYHQQPGARHLVVKRPVYLNLALVVLRDCDLSHFAPCNLS